MKPHIRKALLLEMAVGDEGETVELGRGLLRRTFEHALRHERVLQR